MKKRLLITLVFLTLISTINVGAASNPYKKTTQWGTNCTWYAWNQAKNRAGVTLPGWGNANTWYDYAKKAGYQVGQTPKAKSIVVWEWDKYGHVGYVERVSGDKIYVWDSDKGCIDTSDPEYAKCIENGVSEETDRECFNKYAKTVACEYSASYWSQPGDLIGYIYLDSAQKTTTTKKKTTSTSTKATSTTNISTKVISNNANLSNITISAGNLEFNKDKLTYDIEVDADITKITIDATKEDENATIDGLGEQELIEGLNVIDIVVKALDGTQKTYTLNVRRKAQETTTTTTKMQTTKVNDELYENNFKLDYLIYIGITLVVIIAIIIVIKKSKKH